MSPPGTSRGRPAATEPPPKMISRHQRTEHHDGIPAHRQEARRILRRARRAITASLAERDVDPELVCAAELVVEVGDER